MHIHTSDATVTDEIMGKIKIDVDRDELRGGIALNFSKLTVIEGRYRLSLRIIDRAGYKLKSSRPIMLKNDGLVNETLPNALNTFNAILDDDMMILEF
jgi:hypothetical protein